MTTERTSNATLMTHCGGALVERDFLTKLPDPAPMGKNHKPVRFDELVDKIEMACNFFGHRFKNDTLHIAVAGENNSRLFGIVQLDGVNGENMDLIPGEVGMAMGFRSSTDMTVSLRTVAGGNVFVCDNMALSGQEQIICRKSTKNLRLTGALFNGLEDFFAKDLPLKGLIENARSTKITEEKAKAFLWDTMHNKLVPRKFFGPASEFYFNGEYEGVEAPECQEYGHNRLTGNGTLWGLHNAFTRVFKSEPLIKRYPLTQKLGQLLDLN